MNNKILQRVYKYLYPVLLSGYFIFVIAAFSISLVESFSYSGFFDSHFGLPLWLFISISLVCGVLVSVTPSSKSQNKRWQKINRKLLSVNTKLFILFFFATLILNILEALNYNNFIFSLIHIQPALLFKPIFVEGLSLYVGLSLLAEDKVTKGKIKESVLFTYSAVLLIFMFTNSLIFIRSFYQADRVFLKESELNYALRKIDIFQWIDKFFPKTKSLVSWCNKQSKPVELVTFDPQILWLDYEGLSRVFLTNCYYANIDSVNKTYSYIGRNNMLLVSTTPCDPKLEKIKGNPNGDKVEYLKIVNNQYVCHSRAVVPGLYFYKESNDILMKQ